ncbi:hypothetical protein [Halovulum marinum]|uniref:hypothetical protein n=1 Tax=Halovulum marinum TaxID=2662447 RepID=UPI0012B3A7E3|nr:hypothetical protein [Halovulum marinum]
MKTSLIPRVPVFPARLGRAILPVILLAVPPLLPQAEPVAAETWSARKCALYRDAVDDALALRGRDGLRPEFLRRNEDFIRSGCTTQGHVCPETPQELALADMLTLMTMNAGMASTFVPFGCRPQPPDAVPPGWP